MTPLKGIESNPYTRKASEKKAGNQTSQLRPSRTGIRACSEKPPKGAHRSPEIDIKVKRNEGKKGLQIPEDEELEVATVSFSASDQRNSQIKPREEKLVVLLLLTEERKNQKKK